MVASYLVQVEEATPPQPDPSEPNLQYWLSGTQQGGAGFGKECKSQQKSSTLKKQKPRARWLHR